MLKGFLKRFSEEQPGTHKKTQPTIIPRTSHSISRKDINQNALKVLYRLHDAGFGAYLVGGCVRDLLFGREPKDYDIATNARPEEVRKIFKNSRLIGKRFRLAHIVFGKEIIEVATFRTHHEQASEDHGRSHQGMIVRDNVYGDIEDDVWRRDFTINALYYNIADFSIVDYTNGMEDIKSKTLRIIGDPAQRFFEDPVRLLRATRFLAKLQIQICPETEKSMVQLSHLLQQVSHARLFQEILKMFQEGALVATFSLLEKYNFLSYLFPHTTEYLAQPEARKLLEEALSATDQRISERKSISPAFLLAALLWIPIVKQAQRFQAENLPPYVALEKALQEILKVQTQALAIPRIMTTTIRELCVLQYQFNHCYGSKPYRLLEHPRFRAAYDLLILRAKAGEPVAELAKWWTDFQAGDHAQREKLLKKSSPARAKHKSRMRKFRRSRIPKAEIA